LGLRTGAVPPAGRLEKTMLRASSALSRGQTLTAARARPM